MIGIEYLLFLVILILLMMIPTPLILVYFKDEIRLSRIKLLAFLKPRTPTQKEIADEIKDIKILEQQKADLKELERLRERKKELFREVKNREDE